MVTVSEQPWVGRSAEFVAFRERLESADIVCVVGLPGVGKSTFVKRALAFDGYESITVPLADVGDEDAFYRALALAIDATDDSIDAILEAWSEGPAFVVLDDFDRLVAEARVLLDPLLAVSAGPRVIVTSRERISQTPRPFSLGPLDPADAVALFDAGARRVMPDFELDKMRDLVEELVARLDWLPIAIELATARLRTFSPADLLQRLDRRFVLLAGRAGQRSLESALERSWELLEPDERECLRQCAVFRGGFDLDAVEAVVDLGTDAPWALDVVDRLVDKSLVSRASGSGTPGYGRLGMYESIRDFVNERGDISDELFSRHADYFIELGKDWPRGVWTRETLSRAAAETDNLAAVIERYDVSDLERTCQAARALDAVLRYRPTSGVHERVLERGVASARATGDDALLATLLQARAELGVVTGQLDRAANDATAASNLATEAGAYETLVRSEVLRSEVERRTGQARDALSRLQALDEVLEDADGLRRYVLTHRAACHAELGQLSEARDLAMHVPPPLANADAAIEYSSLKRLAYAHYYLGNYEHQHRLNREALELAERIGDRHRAARARQGLGDVAFARGDYHAVREHYVRALEVHREMGNEHLTGVLLGNLGSAEHRIEEFDDAAHHYEESLAIHQRTGARPYEAVVTFALAVLEHERGHLDDASFRYERAAELFGDLEQPDDVAATEVCRAWLAILREDFDEAERLLDWAEFSAPPPWQKVVEGTRRLVASRRGEDVEPFEVEAPDESLASLLATGLSMILENDVVRFDERLSTTLQGRLLSRFTEAGTPTFRRPVYEASVERTLVVGDGGQWFRLPDGESVNLRRRRAHRLILDRLTAMYESHPGVPLDVHEAFDIGWPGESATAETAAERVYWVVGTLRKMGLDGLLLTSDAGYYLDPGAEVAREETR